MAKGKDGKTLVSKERLQLFKQLLDIQNDSKYVSVNGSASSANTLTTPRTINGVSFNGASNVSNYCICSTAASTVAKEVTLSGFVLGTGARLSILFTNGNTATSPTLSVNQGSAVSITYNGSSTLPESIIEAGGIYEFIYDGSTFRFAATKNYQEFVPATAIANGSDGLVPGPTIGTGTGKYLDATGLWSVPHDTTYTEFVPATSSSAGTSGLVPGPAVGDDKTKFLDATGHWSITVVRYYHETQTAYQAGEIVHVTDFPTNYVLMAETAGTTGSTAPNFASYLT